MFKLNRHKSDKIGERVDFRLSSFQAFQVPKGWDRLILSIISMETGKTIAKASKAMVHGGICQWTETFSETICIPHDYAAKEIEDSFLKFVVTMGSHRTGVLGEVSINLTDYLSSPDSGSFSLPLKRCNYGTIFQIRIQCLNPKTRLRDRRSAKDTTYRHVFHNSNDDNLSKSDGSDNILNRSLDSSSHNHLGVTYSDEPVNQDTSFSASGSHRSSDSGDSANRLNFSPRNNLNGGSHMGRQDSAGSHVSGASSAGHADDVSRSNPSSFNSRISGSATPNRWQESAMQTSHGLAPLSLRPVGSSKDFLEAAEETIEELRDEAKMWERHAQKLKQDIEKFKKESSNKSKRQAELDMELSAAYSERDSLKQEVEQLRSSLKEVTERQTFTRAAKNEVTLRAQMELEEEVKFLKETNANLNLQLKKTQEANVELVSVLGELEETVEKQRVEMANLQYKSPVSDHGGVMRRQKLLDAEEEEFGKLEKLSGIQNAHDPSTNGSDSAYPDFLAEMETLRGKVQELERDCAELTEENLELIYKLKESGKDMKEGNDFKNSEPEVSIRKSQIHWLEEQLGRKEMSNEIVSEPSVVQMKSLEEKCTDLQLELQYFKDQACQLEVKLRESQLEVEEKMFEFNQMKKNLESKHCSGSVGSDTVREVTVKENGGDESDIDDLKVAFSLKEKEIYVLRNAKEELEGLITSLQNDKTQLEENLASALRESSITSKCLEDVQHEMMLLTSSVDSHASNNKMLERKLTELESSKHQLEIQISELEDENVRLSERISGLEAQLRYLTNEKESKRLELEHSESLVADLQDEVAQLKAEIDTQKGEVKLKQLDAQKRLSEAQEETEYLKRSHSKLQSTMENLIEENNSIHKLNGDLKRQKSELHERSAHLEVELSESQKRASDFMERVQFLELRLSSLQNDIVSKEKSLILQLESIFQDHEYQEEKISQAKLMLNQLDTEKAAEMENLMRENAHLSSQVCATHDERERMASDAVLEVSSLRSDKSKLEGSLHEAYAKVKLYETELQSLRHDSGKKVQGLVDLLNASKQSEEMLMSDLKHMQRQVEAAKSIEEKFKRVANELEVKLKASDYEKQQIVDETSSLKVQLQKITRLQDEILVLKSAFEDAKFEKGKFEELLHSVSDECEALKIERNSLMERVSNMQKAFYDAEEERRSRVALEEKLLRLEGDLSAKEASYAHEAELKNETNRIKRANSEYHRKILCLEEENYELQRKAQALEKDLMGGTEALSTVHDDNDSQTQDIPMNTQHVDAGQANEMDDSKLHNLDATVRDLEARIHLLENDLADSVEENNTYKIQLQGLTAEKQSSNTDNGKKSETENDTGLQQASRVALLEAELKDMKERYLNMSLQYAEVEAQREQLVMKLKSTNKKGWFA